MTNARDKANIPVLNFQSKGIDDNADATAITIDSSENVGIKNTTPSNFNASARQLVVGSGSGDNGITIFAGTSNNSSLFLADGTTSTNGYRGSVNYLHNGDALTLHANATETMRLTNGNVAIGHSAPSVKLDVRKTSFTPYNTNTSLIVEAPAVFSQAQHFYIYNAGSYNSSRPTGGIGAVNASSLISLSAGSICTANPGADGFKATATSSSLYDIGSGNHEFKTKTGLTVGDQFTHQTKMIIKDSGSVGIGTVNPQEQLDISSNSPRIRFSDTSVTDLHHKIGSEANDLEISCDAGNDQASSHIGFKIDGSEKVRITDAGRVGIGTSSPTRNLQIQSSASTIVSINSGNSSESQLFFADTDDDNIGRIAYDHSTNAMEFWTNDSERMRIDSSGNVGIGTNSPSTKLDINGGLKFVDTMSFSDSGATVSCFFQASTDIFQYGTSTSDDIAIYTNNAERMRITSGGTVLVSNTSEPSGGDNGAQIANGSYHVFCRNTGGSAVFRTFGSAGEFRVIGSGNAQNTNNSYGALSDRVLKENEVDASSQWNDIKALQIKHYNFKLKPNEKQLGVIAQDLEASGMNGLVENNQDELYTEDDVLPEGKNIGDVKLKNYKSVKYSILYMKSVKALQEAMERIETLEAKVTALETTTP